MLLTNCITSAVCFKLSKFPFVRLLKVGELEAFHFFLPHGLKLPPPLSQAIFAINSPLWFNFAFLPWNIIVKCEFHFVAIFIFTHPTKTRWYISEIFQIQKSNWIRILKGEMSIYVGIGLRQSLQALKGFYTGGLPPIKRQFVIPAGLVLAAIIWPTRAWYGP